MAVKNKNHDTIFSYLYLGSLVLVTALAIYFAFLSHDPAFGDKYADIGYFFKIIGVTHGLFTPLTYLTVKAVRGGYFEPINLLAWLLFIVLWIYTIW